MALPLYALMAYGGKLYTLDDTSVGADQVNGGSYVEFTATLTSSPFTLGTGVFLSLRRLVVNLLTGADLSLEVQGSRNGSPSGALVTRSVLATDPSDVVVPLKVMGDPLQVSLTLSGWTPTSPPTASLGGASLLVVPRRGVRGGSET